MVDTGGVADNGAQLRRRRHRRAAATAPSWCCASTTSPSAEPDHSVAASLAVQGGGASDVDTSERPLSRPARPGRPARDARRSTYRLQVTADFDLARGRPPAALPARPRRRLGLPLARCSQAEPGSDPRLRRRRPRPGRRRRAAAPRAWPRSRPRPARLGMGVLVDIVPNHVGVATPVGQPVVVGRAARTAADSAYADVLRRRLGRPATASCACPSLGDDDEDARSQVRRRRAALPRPPLPDRSRDSRTGDADDGARPPALRAGQLAPRPTPSSTTAASSPSPPSPACASRSRTSSTPPTPRSRRWFDEGLVDGLRVDHPDGLRDPGGYLDDLARLTGGAYVLVEKILEPGEELPDRVGHRRHHRVRRARAARPGAHRPRGRGAARRARRPAARQRHRSTGSELVHDRKRAVADGSLLAETRRIVRELPGPPSADAPGSSRTPWPRCSPASRSTAPTCRAGATHLDEALGDGPAGADPTWPTPSTRSRRSCADPERPRRAAASSRPAAW